MVFKQKLIEKILAGEKTVTRRPANGRACYYRPGRTYAIQTARGKKGIGYVRIIGVQQQSLMPPNPRYLASEAAAEGFESWYEFAQHWAELHGGFDPQLEVWRIRFQLAALNGSHR
jgi:hypothetical protein